MQGGGLLYFLTFSSECVTGGIKGEADELLGDIMVMSNKGRLRLGYRSIVFCFCVANNFLFAVIPQDILPRLVPSLAQLEYY